MDDTDWFNQNHEAVSSEARELTRELAGKVGEYVKCTS